jgi:hypothetical protein
MCSCGYVTDDTTRQERADRNREWLRRKLYENDRGYYWYLKMIEKKLDRELVTCVRSFT